MPRARAGAAPAARTAPGPPGAVQDGLAIDAIVRRVRWSGALLAVLQFILYEPPAGTLLPFSRWWGALPIALLATINVASHRHGRARGTGSDPTRRRVAELVGDSAVILLLIAMFAFDPISTLWTLILVPVLEAALRGWGRGAIAVFAGLCSGYLAIQFAAASLGLAALTADSLTYRLGFLGLVTATVSGLAAQLARQAAATAAREAEARQLREVALASRRMSSLDASTVIHEVTSAARSFGFHDVELRVPAEGLHGGGGARHGHAPALDGTMPVTAAAGSWFESLLAGMPLEGYCVVRPGEQDLELAPDEVAVVATVTQGPVVQALLLGRHQAPVEAYQCEALALLANHASTALANALSFAEQLSLEERLTHQATHDPLTGLPNRALLLDRSRIALARAERQPDVHVAVMLIDIDRFKQVNDVFGHAVGDRVLREVADRISANLRPEDTCARLGGDEFVVLAADQPGVGAIADLARRLRTAVQVPFRLGEVTLDIDASIGVSWAPEHGADLEPLQRRADAAMYAAKHRGSGVELYELSEDDSSTEHVSMLGELRRALQGSDQLVTYFQPIMALDGLRTVGAEALLRWRHPARGLIGPDDFIPAAEGTAVIHQLTDRVFDLALAELSVWNRAGLTVDLSVNLSARALLDTSLGRRIEELLDRHDVAAHQLCLEITETTLVDDPARAIATLQRLREMHVRLSIDDFGTGYSSVAYLRNLPVDEIKIDRSFTADMLGSARDSALVRSVIDLAHSLDLRVVAEGVEDQPTLDALVEVGCDLAQGFYLARPMPAEQFVAWSQSAG